MILYTILPISCVQDVYTHDTHVLLLRLIDEQPTAKHCAHFGRAPLQPAGIYYNNKDVRACNQIPITHIYIHVHNICRCIYYIFPLPIIYIFSKHRHRCTTRSYMHYYSNDEYTDNMHSGSGHEILDYIIYYY